MANLKLLVFAPLIAFLFLELSTYNFNYEADHQTPIKDLAKELGYPMEHYELYAPSGH